MRRFAAIIGSTGLLLCGMAALLYPNLNWHWRVKPDLARQLNEIGGPVLQSRSFENLDYKHSTICDSLRIRSPIEMSVDGHLLKADGFRLVVSLSFPSVPHRVYVQTYLDALSLTPARLDQFDTHDARQQAADLVTGRGLFVETLAMGDPSDSLENCRVIRVENETSIVVMLSSPQSVSGVVVEKRFHGRRDFTLSTQGISQRDAEQIASHLEYVGQEPMPNVSQSGQTQ